jgi:hypothetical protein
MRNEPYQAFEGEVFTLVRNHQYVLHQKLKGVNTPLENVAAFTDWSEAERYAETNKWSLMKRSPTRKVFIRDDFDD